MDHWFINRVYPEGNPQIKRGIVLFSVVNLRNIDYLTWLFVFVNVLFSKCLGLRFLSLCLNFTCCPLFGLITRSTSGDHNVISGHNDVYEPNSRIELETFCLQNKCAAPRIYPLAAILFLTEVQPPPHYRRPRLRRPKHEGYAQLQL